MDATNVPVHEKINENWKASLDNEKNVTLDDLKFIFSQAEKRLDDSIKNFDATTTKSTSFITLTTTLLTALTAYFFLNFDPEGVFSPKLATVIISCIYTFGVLIRFISIVLPRSYQPVGSFPQDLYTAYFFDQDNSNLVNNINNSTRELYACELENYNRRIVHNNNANDQRLKVFTQSAKFICAMPVFGMLIYFLLLLFC